jgi:hypothetical protein
VGTITRIGTHNVEDQWDEEGKKDIVHLKDNLNTHQEETG